ncbi:MAG: hypothetical protein PHU07_12885 [Acidocella sp.]|nr:hypothetical protein [Acidocella sp.]
MDKLVGAFVFGILYLCMVTMRVIGIADNALGKGMTLLGVRDPSWQIYILLVVCTALVVLALRVLGGLLGWCLLLLLVLLLLHRIVPELASPGWVQAMAPLQAGL